MQYSLMEKPGEFIKIPEIDNPTIFNAVTLDNNGEFTIKFPYRKDIKFNEKGSMIYAPFLGSGYYIYRKVGNELSFHSGEGEMLWKKQYPSYPVSDPFGRIVLLLTGDNNRIDLIDLNGNPAGVASVSGNFLSDYNFSLNNSSVIMAFANGDIVLLGKDGNIFSRIRLSEFIDAKNEETLFVKSAAISPDGSFIGVHHVFRERDYVSVFKWDSKNPEKLKQDYTINLDKIYPHVLHIALGKEGSLIATPDMTAFYSHGGKLLWKNRVRGEETVYRPVFSGMDFFVFMDGNYTSILSEKGKTVDNFVIDENEKGPFVILPSRKDSQFVIRSSSTLRYFQFRSSSPDSI